MRCHPLIEISLPLSSCPTPQLLPLLQGIKASVRNSGGHKTWVHLRAEITVAFELAETLNLDRERQVLKDALIRGKHMMLALSSKGSSDANAVADIMAVFTKALPNPHGVPEAVLLADLDTLKLVRKLNGNKNNASRSVTAAATPSTYAPTPFAAAAPVSSYAYPGPAAAPQQQPVSLPLAGTTKGAPGAKKAAAKPPLPPPSARERSDIEIATRQLQAAQQTAVTVPGGPTCNNCTRKGRNPHHPYTCLLYTSPSPRDATLSRMPSSA